MPTNDPTAPRVVGGGAQPCPKCEHPRAVHSSMGCLAARADRTACECLKTQAEIMSAAVLPEEGTTPPALTKFTPEMESWNGCDYSVPIPHSPWNLRCVQGRGHQGAHLLPANPYAPSSVSASSGAGSLRETGAGRGEADPDGQPSMTDAEMADYWCKVANEQDERIAELEAELRAAHVKVEALGVALRANAAEVANLREQSAAASPEGGAPTEEPTIELARWCSQLAGVCRLRPTPNLSREELDMIGKALGNAAARLAASSTGGAVPEEPIDEARGILAGYTPICSHGSPVRDHPLVELPADDWKAWQALKDCVMHTDPEMVTHDEVNTALVLLGKISRLTRSPRAAGEPTA